MRCRLPARSCTKGPRSRSTRDLTRRCGYVGNALCFVTTILTQKQTNKKARGSKKGGKKGGKKGEEGKEEGEKDGGRRRTARLGPASKFVPPGPLKDWLDRVSLLNAGFDLVRKLGTVLALLFPGAPDTSPALYGAIVAVLAGRKSGGFRDLPDGGVACKGSQAAHGCAFWPNAKAAEVIAAIKQEAAAVRPEMFALAVGNTLKDLCNQLARDTFLLRRRQVAESLIAILRKEVTKGEYVKVGAGLVSVVAG